MPINHPEALRIARDTIAGHRYVTQKMYDLAAAYIDATSWTAVEDGLPEDQQIVIISFTFQGQRDTAISRWCANEEYRERPGLFKHYHDRPITHWRPLPPPPETNDES
jgi:hypothetical protein